MYRSSLWGEKDFQKPFHFTTEELKFALTKKRKFFWKNFLLTLTNGNESAVWEKSSKNFFPSLIRKKVSPLSIWKKFVVIEPLGIKFSVPSIQTEKVNPSLTTGHKSTYFSKNKPKYLFGTSAINKNIIFYI